MKAKSNSSVFELLEDPNTVHIGMTGKGGVGKTSSLATLIQRLMDRGTTPVVWDTDYNTWTMVKYTPFQTRRNQAFSKDGFDREILDAMINRVIDEPGPHLIDTGGGSYEKMVLVLFQEGLMDVFKAAGKQVVLHFVVTADPITSNTLRFLLEASKAYGTSAVVWENPNPHAVDFTASKLYADYKDRFLAVVHLPYDQHGIIAPVFSARLTFAQAMLGPSAGVVQAYRLQKAWDDIRNAVDVAFDPAVAKAPAGAVLDLAAMGG